MWNCDVYQYNASQAYPYSLCQLEIREKKHGIWSSYLMEWTSGPCLSIREGILSRYLSKPRRCEIGCQNAPSALTFIWLIGSCAAEVPVKFQSNRTIPYTNIAASRLVYCVNSKDNWNWYSEGNSSCFHVFSNTVLISMFWLLINNFQTYYVCVLVYM